MTKTKEALDALDKIQYQAEWEWDSTDCEKIRTALINDPDTVTIKRSELDRIVRMYDDIIDGYDVCRKTALEHKKILETALGEKK